jgi:hypothetical protein
MIAFVFLLFVGMFAVAGFFISLEAKRRSHGRAIDNNAPKVGRARPDGQ